MTLDELLTALTELRTRHAHLGQQEVTIFFDAGYGQAPLCDVWRHENDLPVLVADDIKVSAKRVRVWFEHPDDRKHTPSS